MPAWASAFSKVGDSLAHPGALMLRDIAVFPKKKSGEAGETIDSPGALRVFLTDSPLYPPTPPLPALVSLAW